MRSFGQGFPPVDMKPRPIQSPPHGADRTAGRGGACMPKRDDDEVEGRTE